MPMPPVFWTALWAGMASPVFVYAPVSYYTNIYQVPVNVGSVGESFAIVGLQLGQAFATMQDEPGPPTHDRHPTHAPVSNPVGCVCI